MKKTIELIKMNKMILYAFSVFFILIDIITAFHFDELYRIIINYLIIPLLAVPAIFFKHKSFWILLVYEIFLSLLICNDLFGITVLMYFGTPDIWHIINRLCVTPSTFGFSDLFQPFLILISVSLLTLLIKKVKR